MQTIKKNNSNILQNLILKEIAELNNYEVMIIYEIVQLLRNNKKNIKPEKKHYDFSKVQELLKDIHGNLSDDIINYREERL